MKNTNSSRSPSARMRSNSPGEDEMAPLNLHVFVIKGENLAAKDRNGTSDPYLVVSLGESKNATSMISKTLNPEWYQTLITGINGPQCKTLKVECWDKDRFGRDYMGEFTVALDELFSNEASHILAPTWYTLESRRSGRRSAIVTGRIQLQLSISDPSDQAATSSQLIRKFQAIISTKKEFRERSSPSPPKDDDSNDDSIDDPDTPTKSKKKLRISRRKRNGAAINTFAFSSDSDVAGVLFLMINRIEDLPPERNVTISSFDMDPFVVTSLGKKTYRTRVVRHSLNPVYDEKILFHVLHYETKYSVTFTIVDRDNLSGNDCVGTVNLPIERVMEYAPVVDPKTGLYSLPLLADNLTSVCDASGKKSPICRKLGLSRRSSSCQSLSPTKHLTSKSPSCSRPVSPDPSTNFDMSKLADSLSSVKSSTAYMDDNSFKSFELPIKLEVRTRQGLKNNPMIYVMAKYMPYPALRQQFWRALLKQYDADEGETIDKVELTTLLDSLGSTLQENTIDGFFKRFPSTGPDADPTLTFDQAVICLEDQLLKSSRKGRRKSNSQESSGESCSSTPEIHTPENSIDGTDPDKSSPRVIITDVDTPAGQSTLKDDTDNTSCSASKFGLSDESNDERIIEIRECPICHQPRLSKRSDADIITHIATCASQDWRKVNVIMMGGFVTSSQASRKWYSKLITKVGYGGYKVGANSANILIQDRITGQILEERMSVYVRLGIRLLYQGLKSRDMENKRIRKLLRSLSVNQGKKFDDPASASQIQGFINFHGLDMSQVLLPTDQFKNFNEFFYRALKPGSRVCCAPLNEEIVTSPADCRSVVFNKIDTAQRIWVKGREFSMPRLLACETQAKKYVNGALGIFRLAPQDYHRFHIPVDGKIDDIRYIEGEYYTVNPMAIRSALDVYGENVRVIVTINSKMHGRVMVICVGAMMVGSTVITRAVGETVQRTEELGYFKFGGSTILLVFEPARIQWDMDLVENSNSALETLLRVGMSVGHAPGYPPFIDEFKNASASETA